MTTDMITEDDLVWFQEKVQQLSWTYAKTMPHSPHSYVYPRKTSGYSVEDAVRAAKTIHVFGRPAKFNGRPKIYLDAPAPAPELTINLSRPEGETTARYWVEYDIGRGESLEDCRILNMSTMPDTWDDGTAPVTETGRWTVYDGLAPGYDEMYEDPEDTAENRAVTSLVHRLMGDREHAPRTLDIGAGTGLALDLGITSPSIYTGVDPSRGMLNRLFRKHHRAYRLIPATAGEALPNLRELGEDFDLVLSLFGVPSYCDPGDVNHAVELIGKGGLGLFMFYKPDYAPVYYEGEERSAVLGQSEVMRDYMVREHGQPHTEIGNFDVWAVRR